MKKRFGSTIKKMTATFVMVAVTFAGMIIPENNVDVVKAAPAGTKETWVVTLDPGHGAYAKKVSSAIDPGVIKSGVKESDLNLKIAMYCKAYLEANASNIKVKMTRDKTLNSVLELGDRTSIAKSYESDLVVSFHNNSSTKESVRGTEVYIPKKFYNAEMKVFANDIIKNIDSSTKLFPSTSGAGKPTEFTGVRYREGTLGEIYRLDEVGAPAGIINPESDTAAYAAYSGDKGAGVLADYYTIICSSVAKQMPAVIIEHGYMSNASDLAILKQESTLKALGEADAKAIIKYFNSGVKENDTYEQRRQIPEVPTTGIGVAYKGHVQNYGWMDWKFDGQMCGTEGQSKRVEALQIYPYNLPEGAYLETSVHIQNYGWLFGTIGSKGGFLGTTGESKRIEALSLNLKNAPGYAIEYRVHIQNIGWSRWMSQGEVAGTSGLSYRLEAIEMRIVPVEQQKVEPSIRYRSHVQNIGWMEWVPEHSMSGTSGKSLRMEAIQIDLRNPEPGMYISADVHIQNYGDRHYDRVTKDTVLGTSGEYKRIEGMSLMLNGTDKYKLQYRVHIQKYGWTRWIDQGKYAGTRGESKRLEAIQIRIVEK